MKSTIHTRVNKLNTKHYKVQIWKFKVKQVDIDDNCYAQFTNIILMESFVVKYEKRQKYDVMKCCCHCCIKSRSKADKIKIQCNKKSDNKNRINKDNNNKMPCKHMIIIKKYIHFKHNEISDILLKQLQYNSIHYPVKKPLKIKTINLLINQHSKVIQSQRNLFSDPLLNNAIISKLRIVLANKQTSTFFIEEWSWSIIKYKKECYLNKILQVATYKICINYGSIICKQIGVSNNNNQNTNIRCGTYCKHVQLLYKGSSGISDKLFTWLKVNSKQKYCTNGIQKEVDNDNYCKNLQNQDEWQWSWIRSISNKNVWINRFNIYQRYKIEPYNSNINKGIRIITQARNKYFVCREKLLNQLFLNVNIFNKFINDIKTEINPFKFIKPLLYSLYDYFKSNNKVTASKLLDNIQSIQIIDEMITNISPNNKKCQYCNIKIMKMHHPNHKWLRCTKCGLIYCCRKCQKKHWNQEEHSHKLQCLQRQNWMLNWIQFT